MPVSTSAVAVRRAPFAAGAGFGLDWLAAPRRATWVLLLLALAAFVPGLTSVPPIDRDEARFVQASKQMLESGDFFDIRFQHEPRYKKPIGIYWLQTATVASLESLGVENARASIWAYRLPSLTGAIAAVLLTFWCGVPLVGRRAAFLGATALASCVLLGIEARLAKTDAVLLATIVAMQGALARVYLAGLEDRAASLRDAMLFWLAFAAGVLVKGPMPLLIASLTVLGLVLIERRPGWLRALRPALGIPLALLVIAPWFVAIGLYSGGSFYSQSLGQDFASKIGSGVESHGAPPLAYLLAVWGTFWPASIFLGVAAVWTYRSRHVPATRFLLAWLVPTWIVLELVPTKLPHYVLPLYPALALLLGSWLAKVAEESPPRWAPLAAGLLLALVALGVPATIAAASWILDGRIALELLPSVLAAILLIALAIRAWARGCYRRAFGLAVATSVVTMAGCLGVALPELRSLWISPRLAAAVSKVPCADPALASAGYEEPSLVFLTRTDVRLTGGEQAGRFLAEGGCRAAFVEGQQRQAFERGLAESGVSPVLVARVTGWNLSKGNRVDIAVFATVPR